MTTMKICKICLQSNFLCSGCSEKLESGKITKTDVAITRAIHKMADTMKNFNADFLKSFESDKFIVIMADSKHTGMLIGKAGRNVKKLGEMLGKNVKVIEKTSEKEMIETLLNVPILAINKIYAGHESYRIRIEKRFEKRVDKKLFQLIEKIIEKPVEVIFE